MTEAATGSGRIGRRFAALAEAGRAGLVTFVMAGDPDAARCLELVRGLPAAGADLIELGMAFTDPMADGPAIQAAGLRALKAGQTLAGTLELVRAFRGGDDDTPIILMGYYNPIYSYGVARFLADARAAGVDGLIIVDLPPEEDVELCLPTLEAGLHWIRLATPTTDDERLPTVLSNTSGFVYYVAILGITGTRSASGAAVREAGGHRGYWLLVAGFFVCGFHVAFIQTHLPSYITDLGLAPELGAWALASVGLFNVVGAYTSGVLGGRYSQKYLLSGLYVLRAVAIALFVLSPASVASVLMFSVAIGLLWLSTVPLTYGVVAQIFGPRYMATLFGFVFFSHQVGASLGVWLGGYLFAATGSYVTVWWMTVALALFAALVHLPIDDRQVVRPAEAG